jgi:hypothetical protein
MVPRTHTVVGGLRGTIRCDRDGPAIADWSKAIAEHLRGLGETGAG